MSKNPFKAKTPNASHAESFASFAKLEIPTLRPPSSEIGDKLVRDIIGDVIDAWQRGKVVVSDDPEAMKILGQEFVRISALARNVLLQLEELFKVPEVKAFIAEHGTKAIVDLASDLSGAPDEQYGEIVAAVAGAYAKTVSGMMALFYGKGHLDDAFTQATAAGALLATGAMTLQATGREPELPGDASDSDD